MPYRSTARSFSCPDYSRDRRGHQCQVGSNPTTPVPTQPLTCRRVDDTLIIAIANHLQQIRCLHRRRHLKGKNDSRTIGPRLTRTHHRRTRRPRTVSTLGANGTSSRRYPFSEGNGGFPWSRAYRGTRKPDCSWTWGSTQGHRGACMTGPLSACHRNPHPGKADVGETT